MGSGIGSIPIDRLVKSVEDLMQATVPAGFAIATKAFPLSKVETVWGTAGNIPRVVFQIPQTASPAECFTMVALSFEEADQLADSTRLKKFIKQEESSTRSCWTSKRALQRTRYAGPRLGRLAHDILRCPCTESSCRREKYNLR